MNCQQCGHDINEHRKNVKKRGCHNHLLSDKPICGCTLLASDIASAAVAEANQRLEWIHNRAVKNGGLIDLVTIKHFMYSDYEKLAAALTALAKADA